MTRAFLEPEETDMIALAMEPEPCGWDEVYAANGCSVEFESALDEGD